MSLKKKLKKKKRKGHYHTGSYTSLKTNLASKYRSGWELKYMQYLDVCSDVCMWEYESFTIDYVSNRKTGRVRRYIPDFKVQYNDGHIEVVEIKPSKRLVQATVAKKITAAQVWCSAHNMAYKIITEIELKNLGLL